MLKYFCQTDFVHLSLFFSYITLIAAFCAVMILAPLALDSTEF